ncbi:MAG TPA: hypothetical protein VNX28_11665 [Gemmataceae bacterium]|jgi:multidrug efflux pump subunit AcrA (membrane-fusion protein)|nr:hypothetical protein [Gemmataceae bacterium]
MTFNGISAVKPNAVHSPWFRLTFVIVIIAGCLGAMALPPVRETVHGWFAGKIEGQAPGNALKKTVELIEANGSYGLRVNAEAMTAMEIKSEEVKTARQAQPLPPQSGHVNFDNERLFVKRPQFPGEVVEFGKVVDTSGGPGPTNYRPLRWGDRVKQDELLAVIWSQQFGTAKAALVDAISARRQSEELLKRYQDNMEKGIGTLSGLQSAKRQFESDTTTYNTAERSLRMWKLSDEEIEKIKEEAKLISEQTQVRNPDREKNWARVEVKAPKFCDDPNRELTIVQKDANYGELVDPSRDTPLFKLADLSRLQIWVYPPPDYLPLLREQATRGTGNLKWQICFQDDPPNTPPLELDILQVSPSLDPNQQRPMVIGYLPNPDNKFLVGQALTATIFLSPEPDTVEIPTDALNQVDGQNLVFVAGKNGDNEFYIRRVAVVKSFQKVIFVRSKLTVQEETFSREEEKKGRRSLQPLLPGERVLTRGVLELTAALDEALSTQK